MKLFPYALMRRGGGAFDNFERLEFNKVNLNISEILKEENNLKELSKIICDEIFKIIKKSEDSKTQNKLLNLKRSIFNLKAISNEKYQYLLEFLTKEKQQILNNYVETFKIINDLKLKGIEIYKSELQEKRIEFKKLVSDVNFQNGLLLSSQSLLERANGYLKKDVKNLNKKDKKTEQSLLKYISRMYAKTSPFSTFTNLSITKNEKINENFSSTENSPNVVSHIRLNNNLFKYLIDLFKNNEKIYRNLHLRPNPSISKNENSIKFLTNSNNVESFQSIEYSPVIDLFLEKCSKDKNGVVYKDLVESIAKIEELEASNEEIKAYLNQLIKFGLLEFNIGISGIDPDWDLKLREKLNNLQNIELLKQLIETLKRVRKLAESYETEGTDKRQLFLQQAFDMFKEICMKLHEDAGLPEVERMNEIERKEFYKKKSEEQQEKMAEDKESEDKVDDEKEKVFEHRSNTFFYFKPEQMFYEDTTVDHQSKFNYEKIEKTLAKLNTVLKKMESFEGHLFEQKKMLNFFEKFYVDETEVNILKFYEDYYREVKIPEEKKAEENKKKAREKDTESKENNENSEGKKDLGNTENELKNNKNFYEKWYPKDYKNINEINEKWIENLFENIKINDEKIEISLESIENNINENKNVRENVFENTSLGAFVQFFYDFENEKYKVMLNGSFSGYGKMFSRFLHLFSDEVTNDIRKNNEANGKDFMLAEDVDASVFNANLHPPLMPYEVWLPGSQNSLPTDKQIPVTDLVIKKENGNLMLFNKKENKRVFVFDLCFQAHNSRSKLFQILEKFSLSEFLSTGPISSAINKKLYEKNREDKEVEQKNEITTLPRISIDDSIIIQRKKWVVPVNKLPLKGGDENDYDYFLKINKWRKELLIPDNVFVTMVNRGTLEYLPKDKKKKIGRDDYKPQYISFNNPFLVVHLEKMMQKVPVSMEFSEMLPGVEDLTKLGNEKYVTEWVVQWNK